MGNSQKAKGSGGKGKKKKLLQANRQAFLRRTGLTPADAGVAARRAISVTHGGIQAAEGIPGIKPLVWFSSHVATKYVKAYDNVTFEGIPTQNGIQELLFSLPRFATLREKEIGGRALPDEKTSELGSVKIVWRDSVLTGQEFAPNYRSYGTTSFTQANKNDAKACGQAEAGAGSGSGGGSNKAFASTTRAGKVVGLNEARSCTVNQHKYIGEPWSSRICYRTMEYLQDIGAIPKPAGTEEEELQRKAKRQRRRQRAEERAEAERGGAPCPPPVPVEDGPPPVPTEEQDAGQ